MLIAVRVLVSCSRVGLSAGYHQWTGRPRHGTLEKSGISLSFGAVISTRPPPWLWCEGVSVPALTRGLSMGLSLFFLATV